MAERRDELADLVAALGEHIVDLERRVSAIEAGEPPPKRIAASDLRRVTKALMRLSLGVAQTEPSRRKRNS
ncbi:MAG: hypothetical protein JO347_11230 [Candidatus Eremiobacteraeota bacterium]|nr:hypothetical protein [Candidatus Eremiobacteraeota bacterium]